ncbi:MAG: hypothetical protein M0P61_17305 [Ignavibacteriaceae bacterium]|nr:hypothetical protein [Ignavibacteriaceae bacterium]
MEEKINIMEITLNKVLNYLEILSEENFEVIFPKAKLGMEYVNRLKTELKNQFTGEELTKFEERLLAPAKLIKNKFDDIVTLKKVKLAVISEEISHLQNQKKIVNYYR